MEPEVAMYCLQDLATSLYPEPYESNLYPQTLFP
jgi:hypothetical protein